ncbi:helix-turn-helix domain-containing protein [Streptomyces sp. G45]|uniref:helix-turn-helix domain-containing protein n=1 Tax=Streptomyces sp. G45 TaxID=3406627 RepID=UPI003C201E2A
MGWGVVGMGDGAPATPFGAAMKRRRGKAGMSLRTLAARANYTPGWLSKLENGRGLPTVEAARILDTVLGADGELVELARAGREPGGPGQPRPAQLPPAVGGFTGRLRELRQLDALLAEAERDGTVLLAAFDGPPGAGKSAVTVHWAHRVAPRFPGGVLFTDLQAQSPDGRRAPAARVLEQFLVALGVPAKDIPPEQEQRAALFRSLAHGRPLLVVLDNAADSQHVRPLLVGASGCAVVITSRRRLTGLAASTGARRISLGPLTADESYGLLSTVIGEARADAEATAVRELARQCDHLPLALRIAAERLATYPHRTVADAVAELADDALRLDALADRDDPHLGIRSVFLCSYRELDEPTARAFRLLGLHPASTVTAHAAAALLGRSLPAARHVLESLATVHLLEETGHDRYRFHDLLRDYAAERALAEEAEPDRAAAVERLAAWYTYTVEAASRALAPQREVERLGETPPGVPPMDFASPDEARAWCDATAEEIVPMVALAARHRLDAAWQIPLRLWDWLLLRKPWSLWIESHTVALRAAAAADDTAARAWVAMNLGEGYRQSGARDQARRHIAQGLELRRELGDRHGQAWALASLGFLATDEGAPEQAAARFERALALFEEIDDRHGQAIMLASLCEARFRLGDRDGAGRAFEASLRLARALGDSYGEGHLWFRRGTAHHAAGEHAEALDCLDHAIDCRRAAGDDWGLAEAHRQRGDVLAALGDDRRDEARAAWERARGLFGDLGDPRAAELDERLGARG